MKKSEDADSHPKEANTLVEDESLKPKLFVLDTNVLIHDPWAIYRFKENDVFIPMKVLEELDGLKKGLTEVARNARETNKLLDGIIGNSDMISIKEGIPLSNEKFGVESLCQGKLKLQTDPLIPSKKGLSNDLVKTVSDHIILRTSLALHLLKNGYKEVVFVSKDINARIKAKTLGIRTQDYYSDQSVSDISLLYSGTYVLTGDFWDEHCTQMESWKKKERTFYRLHDPIVDTWYPNQFIYVDDEEGSFEAIVKSCENGVAELELLKNYRVQENNIWGITARNREQNFLFNVLLNPDIDFVTILGDAGTGKTLSALASALVMTIEQKLYTEIIMTRETIPIGEDIGFLPGTEEEKMAPWMGALMDNLELLGSRLGQNEWEQGASKNILMNRVKIRSLNFMRGRTFLNRYLILDEAQNLTSKQMKTLITRAGPGTKIVCIGNLSQIDTPYLSATTSGLSYVVERFKPWSYGAHITLRRGERSRLADYANDVL
jgi:PhoH-like ATPase